MQPSAVYQDQSFGFGSRVEVIGVGPTYANAGTFVLENINMTYPTKRIERPDQIGQPNGWVIVRAQPTGSCLIQVGATNSVPNPSGAYPAYTAPLSGDYPHVGQSFSDFFTGTNLQTWVIDQVGAPYEINGYFKVNANLVMTKPAAGWSSVFDGASF